ncbi:MAG: adenylate/guanylate cyclase domain-containing protein [Deltaproteobacteria bacterium]|nr:adenylate/guanylate cyclase domain-containing protein [Deltaproteobacteria bacterium]
MPKKIFQNLFALSALKVAVLITLATMILFMVNYLTPGGTFFSLLDKKWVDSIMKNRGTVDHTPGVVIVTADAKSVDAYGRWPWPRFRLAQVVEALNKHYDVAVIGFDIVFSEPEQASSGGGVKEAIQRFQKMGFTGPKAEQYVDYLRASQTAGAGDKLLGQNLAKKQNNVLGYFFQNDPDAVKHLTTKDRADAAKRIAGSEIFAVIGDMPPGLVPVGNYPTTNIWDITKGGYRAGFFNVEPDPEDGTVRRVHIIYQHEDQYFPSLDLQMMSLLLGEGGEPAPIVVNAEGGAGIQSITVGSEVIVPNQDGSILLNYKGPAQTFPHYSMVDVVEHKVPKELLQGRAVILGNTDVGTYDLRTTAVGAEYPGVEVHATLLDNLLTQSYFNIGWENDMVTLILLLVLGLAMGVILTHMTALRGALLTVAVAVIYSYAHQYMVNEYRTWTSYVFVMIEILSIWGGVTLYQFLVSDRDKRFIKGAFAQYLSPAVIDQLVENPAMLKLGGERRVCTAFFSDVAGFSSFSEKMEPEELVALLNVYLTAMSDIVMKYGGTVDKYEGDAIIAFYGAPVPYEDHAARAILTSLEMQETLVKMRADWAKEGKPQLKVRIGLNTGPMVVGNMGSQNRFDYTMMGNTVNLASRLEGANKNYGSYACMSEMTYEPAKDTVEARELDLIRVMGIAKPVRLYEIMARKGQLAPNVAQGREIFHKGLALYRDQQWDNAIATFNQVMAVIPDDGPAKSFIERCQEFKASPPPKEWDGVFVSTSK